MSDQTEQIEQSRSEGGTEVVEQITMDTSKRKRLKVMFLKRG